MVRQAHHNGLSKSLKPALDVIFAPHGGIEAVIPQKRSPMKRKFWPKDLFKNNSALLQPTHGGARRGLMM
jgi:hypothetical protein